MDKLKMHTPNKADENFMKLAKMFPNAVTETIDEVTGEVIRAIDKDVLMQEISCKVVEGNEERYQFTWPDKKKSVLLANAPISKTLRPCKEESVGKDGTVGFDSENLYIEGDNLEVLKLLQETYLGKIKIIYIDPPYNTGNDFIYEDDFSLSMEEYLTNSGQYDNEGNRLVTNSENNGRFHTDWLNMIYPRLRLAKDLLSEDGIVFISIGQAECHNLVKCCNELFGESNRIGVVSRVMKSGGGKGQFFSPNIDYILVYAKNISNVEKFRVNTSEKSLKNYYKNKQIDGLRKGELYGEERIYVAGLDSRPNQRYWIECPDGSFVIPPNGKTPTIIKDGEKITPNSGDGCWKWTYETYLENKKAGNIVFKQTSTSALVDENGLKSKYNLYNKVWLNDKEGSVPGDLIAGFENRQSSKELKELNIPFDFSKPVNLIKYLLTFINTKDAIILDFFSGSATTAHAIMQLNVEDEGERKFIMVQIPETIDSKSEAYKAGFDTICEIGKERIRRAGKKIKEETGADIDYGFRVLKCDTTNMKDVYYNPSEYQATLFDELTDNIKEDRTTEDLLFQVMLDLGVELSSTIEENTIDGKKVFNVADGFLIACFDNNVTEETITAIAKQQPYYFVMRDRSLANDSVAINFDQIFTTYSPDTVRKVL